MLIIPVKAYAHGVDIEYTSEISIVITAKYDTGEPMAEAQVTIYTPDDPSTPWLTGTCDDEGQFTFTPDTSIPGDWKVKVRLAGHGDISYITVSESGVEFSSDSGYTTLQIVLMSICVVWGTTGTALFFLRRRKT
jgi:nickel transport protein